MGVGTVNGINLEDGDYTFPIMSRNEGLVVKLTNSEYLQVLLLMQSGKVSIINKVNKHLGRIWLSKII